MAERSEGTTSAACGRLLDRRVRRLGAIHCFYCTHRGAARTVVREWHTLHGQSEYAICNLYGHELCGIFRDTHCQRFERMDNKRLVQMIFEVDSPQEDGVKAYPFPTRERGTQKTIEREDGQLEMAF